MMDIETKILTYLANHPTSRARSIATALKISEYDALFMDAIMYLHDMELIRNTAEYDEIKQEYFYKWHLSKKGQGVLANLKKIQKPIDNQQKM